MSGIGYVEPYEVASMVTVNKTYARNRFSVPGIDYVEPYQVASIVIMNKPMPGICFVNKTYAKKLCYVDQRSICSVNQ